MTEFRKKSKKIQNKIIVNCNESLEKTILSNIDKSWKLQK